MSRTSDSPRSHNGPIRTNQENLNTTLINIRLHDTNILGTPGAVAEIYFRILFQENSLMFPLCF